MTQNGLTFKIWSCIRQTKWFILYDSYYMNHIWALSLWKWCQFLHFDASFFSRSVLIFNFMKLKTLDISGPIYRVDFEKYYKLMRFIEYLLQNQMMVFLFCDWQKMSGYVLPTTISIQSFSWSEVTGLTNSFVNPRPLNLDVKIWTFLQS